MELAHTSPALATTKHLKCNTDGEGHADVVIITIRTQLNSVYAAAVSTQVFYIPTVFQILAIVCSIILRKVKEIYVLSGLQGNAG